MRDAGNSDNTLQTKQLSLANTLLVVRVTLATVLVLAPASVLSLAPVATWCSVECAAVESGLVLNFIKIRTAIRTDA